MFDISWTEFVLIGVVALIVIGPKELPAVMRTVGQWTRKVRSMAADFQHQFQEAMREAEMADLKKQVDDLAHDVKNYDPLKDVKADVEAAGRDIQATFEQKPQAPAVADMPAPAVTAEESPVLPGAETPAASGGEVIATATAPVAPDAIEKTEAENSAAEPSGASGSNANNVAAVAAGPVTPEAAATATSPDSEARSG